jgi:hypothetical protein
MWKKNSNYKKKINKSVNNIETNDGSFWSCFSEIGPKHRVISISDD